MLTFQTPIAWNLWYRGGVFFDEGLHMYLVVSYDIHDDKRRNRVHKVLKNFGERIQFSVFECDLTKEQLLCSDGSCWRHDQPMAVHHASMPWQVFPY